MSLEFYSSKTQKAKKNHECYLCHQQIAAGEAYIRNAGKYEGDFFDLKFHLPCENLVQKFVDGQCEEEFTDDDVIADISQCVCCDCEQENKCPFTRHGRARCEKVIATYRTPEVHNE